MASLRKRGNKWQAQVRLTGAGPITRSFPFKKDAVQWASVQESKLRLGEYAPPDEKQTNSTVGEMLVRYAAEDVGKKRCAEYERIMIGALLRTDLARIRLCNITSRPFARYRDVRLQSVGPAVVRRELIILQHMFETAIREWGYTFLKNPISQVKKPKEPPSRNRRLEPHEEQLLFDGCNGSKVSYLKPIIIIALETGMRRGEILRIEHSHINEPLRTLRIPITKNDTPRVIPLSKRALTTLLEACRGHSEPLFTVSPNAFRLAWERLRKRAGIDDLHFHDLRHEAISRLFEKGLSIPEVALISGHRDVRMLFRYTHLRAEDIAQRLD